MQSDNAFEIRRAGARGSLETSWLSARFSFSFGSYQDRARDNFGPLRALNEDTIRPGAGFPMHPHRDMEIFILPLAGVVEHRDSLGNHGWVRPGEVQRMSAGDGIEHSQFNASDSALDHHLQVWLKPRSRGGVPRVEARDFGIFDKPGRWTTIVSPDGVDGSFRVDQAARLSTVLLASAGRTHHAPRAGSSVYLHVALGEVQCRQQERSALLAAGDALVIRSAGDGALELTSHHGSSLVLLFEFACG